MSWVQDVPHIRSMFVFFFFCFEYLQAISMESESLFSKRWKMKFLFKIISIYSAAILISENAATLLHIYTYLFKSDPPVIL